MKAVVMNRYGGPEVVEIKEIANPKIGEKDILVRVEAAGLNAGDIFSMRGSPWLARFSVGFPKPRDYVLGWDVAGRVEAVGKETTRFKPGDMVFGGCNHAFAEYVSAEEDKFAKRPANLTVEQSASLSTAGVAALQALRDQGQVQPGWRVLINGATGGVGTFSVQIAKALGAKVTAVCSTEKVDLVRSLGADEVVDYTKEDFASAEHRYDLILDNVGSRSFKDLKKALKSRGVIVPNTGHAGMSYVFKAYLAAASSRTFVRPFMAVPKHKDLEILKEFCESGKLVPVIDKTFSMNEAMEAFRYLDLGHARGKVVLLIKQEG